ncbi:MAG: hypothetical protein U5O39_06180 [Gammaproteobacteria bacterium]|nr:hypothetical protein [Gammaproteobacteria bacterium]
MSISHIDVDNGYDAFSLDNTRTTLSDNPGRDRQRSNAVSVDSLWHADNMDVQVIAAVSDSEMDYRYDEDWTFEGFHDDGYSSVDAYVRDRQTRSLEVRLLSPRGGARDNRWVAGLYMLDSDTDLERQYTFLAEPFFSNYAFTSSAAFVQGDFPLTDRLELSAGLRYERGYRIPRFGITGILPDR